MEYKKRGTAYKNELCRVKHELKCSLKREEINARKISQFISGKKWRDEAIQKLAHENIRLRTELQNEKFCNG